LKIAKNLLDAVNFIFFVKPFVVVANRGIDRQNHIETWKI